MRTMRITLLPISSILMHHLLIKRANSLYHKAPILIITYPEKEQSINYKNMEMVDVKVGKRSEGVFYEKKLVRVNGNLVFTEYRMGPSGVTKINHY
jgi:hypothetical protein